MEFVGKVVQVDYGKVELMYPWSWGRQIGSHRVGSEHASTMLDWVEPTGSATELVLATYA